MSFFANWGQVIQVFVAGTGVAGLAGLYRFAKCHETGCRRLGVHPDGPYRWCREHDQRVPSTGPIHASVVSPHTSKEEEI